MNSVGSKQAAGAHMGLLARELRTRRKMTLDELALQVGLSKGHLSRFERGQKTISVAALMRMAEALGTSVATLIGENLEDGALHLVRASNRKFRKSPAADGGYSFSALSSATANLGVEVFVVQLAANTRHTSTAYHSGREIVFVLDGTVDITLADRVIRLEKGDYLEFPGHLEHAMAGLDQGSEVLIAVVQK